MFDSNFGLENMTLNNSKNSNKMIFPMKTKAFSLIIDNQFYMCSCYIFNTEMNFCLANKLKKSKIVDIQCFMRQIVLILSRMIIIMFKCSELYIKQHSYHHKIFLKMLEANKIQNSTKQREQSNLMMVWSVLTNISVTDKQFEQSVM
ncbi:Hypothetical_protein [Hexamita inflata]|uniref:Hypothetical_protein n=1 Tax=Hexamita inflata TaxID=28002 RepID=A0AA86UNX5_9EUKA|nr:Hypothetical protein HINF_LOCUS46366 [Hexamita inflata]